MKPFDEIRFNGTEEEINAQWLEERKKGIGGSDAAAILGMSKYLTPLSVWLQKTGREESPDLSDNAYVYWGNVLEDVVAAEFAKRHPEYIIRRKNALLRSKKYPFMQASLDRVITEKVTLRKGILEIKTASAHMDGDWEEGIPDYYLPQPTHYLAVTEYDFYAVAVLIGGNLYKEYIYERDQEDIDALIVCEVDFWENFVLKDVMPEVTDKDSKVLTAMHPVSDDEFLYLVDMDIPEISEYLEIKARIKADKERVDLLGNQIKQKIGDSKGIVTHTKKITWVRCSQTKFDRTKFEIDYPHVYDQYTHQEPKDNGLRISEVK